MRKILALAFVVATFNQCALAQINANTILIDGTTSMTYAGASSNGASAEAANIAIKTGFFVARNFVLGASVAFSYTGFSQPNQQTIFSRTTAYGAFGRYYLSKLFIGAGYSRAIVSNYGIGLSSSKSPQIPLEMGYAGFLTDNITIEPVIIYIIGENVNTLAYGIGFGLYFNRQLDK